MDFDGEIVLFKKFMAATWTLIHEAQNMKLETQILCNASCFRLHVS
jgi:hypothetical protein